MKSPLLTVANLDVTIESKSVVQDFNVSISDREVVVIVGANGSGKSSVAMTLMGDTRYNVTTNQQTNKPSILFGGKDLLKMSADERAKSGLYVAWQNPIAIPGVSVFSLCKASFEAHGNKIGQLVAFKNKIEDLLQSVGLPKEYIARNVNDGFSGGEKKRFELLQLQLLTPKLAILDEIDSGLDTSGVKILVKIINMMKTQGTSFLLITHNKKMLEEIGVDKILEMKHGRLSART